MTESPENRQAPSARHAFSRWAAGPCPPLTGFLLVLSGQLEPVDDRGADRRLDEHARSVFGVSGQGGHTQMLSLARVLTEAPGFTLDETTPHGLHLDVVLERRAGHPMMLAVVLAEVGRRAGLDTGVFSSPDGWYAGQLDRESLWLVDPSTRQLTAPDLVRRHCGHELAYAVLLGLAHRYAVEGDRDRADRATALRRQLSFHDDRLKAEDPDSDPLKVLWA